MKTLISIVAIAVAFAFSPVVASAAECAGKDEHADSPALRTAGAAIDPVCGMEVKTSNAKYVYEYKRTKFYFCSEEDLRKFQASPGKYVSDKESPSQCAGKEEHAKNPHYRTGNIATDPVCGMEVKTVGAKYTYEYKGKRYYFCEKKNLEKFKKDPEKYIK